MSWSGFKKAVNRAGAQVLLKTNKQSINTVDQAFNQNEENFGKLDKLTNDLDKELNRVIEYITDLTEVQMNIVKTVDSFYGDYSFETGYDKKVEAASEIVNDSESYVSKTGHKLVNNRDGLSLEYLKVLNDLKENIMPQVLEPYQLTVFEPLKQLKDYNVEIGKLIKKRYRKKLDYDAVLTKVTKLESECEAFKTQLNKHIRENDGAGLASIETQLEKSMEKLERLKPSYTESKTIYDDLNDSLKEEIQKYISLRLSIIDPVFESFIKIQLKMFKDIHSTLAKVLDGGEIVDGSSEQMFKIDAQTREEYLNGGIDKSLDDILLKMKQLDIKTM